ncbi:MAG: methyltransferase domain-containing protein [Rhodocyclaceae bacterium]|nr:methyltransferase domain-containing protein [Rhodocyclaceae bacterium]
MAAGDDYRIDRRAVRRNCRRHAASAVGGEAVVREVAARMDERLDYIRLAAQRILDLGCGTGADRARLQSRYRDARIVGADACPALLDAGRRGGLLARLLGGRSPVVAADALALPFRRASFDMVWSNLMLQWLDDPAPALAEIHRVLEVDGMVMFSTLGPDSLKELRRAFPENAVHRFIDMHDIGDALVRAGFGDPVMDMQMLTVTYADATALLAELRGGGNANARADRPRGLTGTRAWRARLERLEDSRRDGVLPVTLELVFGHAWKQPPKTDERGHPVIRFHPARP